MTLFQNAVLKKYLNDLHKEDLHPAWLRFSAHFHNPTLQTDIHNSKEEECQERMQHFEQEKAKAKAIQQTIDETDKEIDRMVYELYELTEEEIKIVEGS